MTQTDGGEEPLESMTQGPKGSESKPSKLPWDPDTAIFQIGVAMDEASKAYKIRMENLKQALDDGRLTPQQFQKAVVEELEESSKARHQAGTKVLNTYLDQM